MPASVPVLLPRGDHVVIPIESCAGTVSSATSVVIKDGGDDPDVTHGAHIVVRLLRTNTDDLRIEGGEGVGRVTKPGLGLEIGGPAINPVPRRMILDNLREVAGTEPRGFLVTISVPEGRDLAPKTDNPRLGIVGGISILGTSGIVMPFSTASFAASIRQNLNVARAMGDDTVVLTTGGRSEAFAQHVVSLPEHCFVQMGDFAGYAVQQCFKVGISKVYVVGFVGKLAKMAAGVSQTHVKGSKVDMALLAGVALQCGARSDTVAEIRRANTARHVMEIVIREGIRGFFDAVCGMVLDHMKNRGKGLNMEIMMFDFDGCVVGRASFEPGM